MITFNSGYIVNDHEEEERQHLQRAGIKLIVCGIIIFSVICYLLTSFGPKAIIRATLSCFDDGLLAETTVVSRISSIVDMFRYV